MPVALLSAPTGYGKTTLLGQWAARDVRPFAWVTLDESHNDPARLLAAVALALDAVEPVGWEVLEALSSRHSPAAETGQRLLCRSIGRSERPVVLVLDDLHVLRSREARRVVKALWGTPRPGFQLALASRSGSALPLGRLRAQGKLIELGSRDLTMTRSEASELLSRAGLRLTPDHVLTLMQRTEGWPAGLYLATLSLREQHDITAAVVGFGGDDRLVFDYVSEEVLSGLSGAQLEFLIRGSLLDELSAPLCDAVLGREDSAELLAALARSNVLIVALDRRDEAYRHHRLFRDVLRAELGRRRPRTVAGLHRRASAWYSQRGDAERAILHAIEARDVERAGRLLWDNVLRYAGRGEQADISNWLGRFRPEEIAESPALGLVAASNALAAGDLAEAARWTSVAGAGAAPEAAPQPGDIVPGGLALMRAGLGRQGLAALGADAARAHALLAEHSPWRPLCRFFEGVAFQLRGEPGPAAARLEEGAHLAAVSAPIVQALCLAQLALLSAGDGDPERASALAARARAQVERCGLDECPALALVLAVSTVLRAGHGLSAAAGADLARALVLLDCISDPSPWYEAQCRILLARAALRLSGPAAASELVDGAARALRRTPDAPLLSRWLDEIRTEVDLALESVAGADWSLTSAELRVLRHLPSHLSFREIAVHLYVSPNTVKTHARAIYRKLGVSCRANAVESARRAGLVDPVPGG